MDYVTHTCRRCECAFVAEDFTKVKDIPPRWRLCPDCCKELGIDYDKQRPWTNRTSEQQKAIDERMAKLKIIGAAKLREYHKKKKLKCSKM